MARPAETGGALAALLAMIALAFALCTGAPPLGAVLLVLLILFGLFRFLTGPGK